MNMSLPCFVGVVWNNSFRILQWLGINKDPIHFFPRTIKVREIFKDEDSRKIQVKLGTPGFYIQGLVVEYQSSADNTYGVVGLRITFTRGEGTPRLVIDLESGEIDAILHRTSGPTMPDEYFPAALAVKQKWAEVIRNYYR